MKSSKVLVVEIKNKITNFRWAVIVDGILQQPRWESAADANLGYYKGALRIDE